VANSLFADNPLSVDIDRTEGIEVFDTKIIGESESYRKLAARQAVGAVCDRGGLTGIDLHTWKVDKAWAGVKFSNIDISGFNNTASCASPKSIKFDTNVRVHLAKFEKLILMVSLNDCTHTFNLTDFEAGLV
jgi:hypothetical protein